MRHCRFGEFLCVWTFLLLSATPASGGVEIRDSRLFVAGESFRVRGVVYSSTPIGHSGTDVFTNAGCRYARDLPLIAAMGANTVRTSALVRPDDRAFRVVLERTGLHWLAGFPLDPYFDTSRSLSPETADGRELRTEILTSFDAFVGGWEGAPILAYVFGDDVSRNYENKFDGDVTDYYSLLAEAAALVRQEGDDPFVTTTVSDPAQIGSVQLGTNDSAQPDLAFWSLNRPGSNQLTEDIRSAQALTGKPVLISEFGIDAYDAVTGEVDRAAQAEVGRSLAQEIDASAEQEDERLLGGVYAAFVDEWWRGGNPSAHTEGGRELPSSPDGVLNEGWLGLFRTSPSLMDGLDRLRARDVYFALAEVWGGSPPPELTDVAVPTVFPDQIRNMAGRLPLLSPGGLFVMGGSDLASMGRSVAGGDWPLQLGPVSVCMQGQPTPLVFAVEDEIRGQVPSSTSAAENTAVVYRAGIPSGPALFDVAAVAPGIFEDGVFRPGRPCPVNEENGVPPGSYLEIYGSGLGGADEGLADGVGPDTATALSEAPVVTLGGRGLPVLFSGLLPGVPGVAQTNVTLADDFPPGSAALVMEKSGVRSNEHRLRVTSAEEQPGFRVALDGPDPVILQAGGPSKTVFVLLNGMNGFCDLIRFELTGVPTGVRASLPVGVPGQTVPLTLAAEAGALPIHEDPIVLTGRSLIPQVVNNIVHVTVLPSLGTATYRVVSGGWLSTAPVASFEVDGSFIYRVNGGGAGRGFNFLTIDTTTGLLGPVRSFDTWASDADVIAMEEYLESLPDAVLVFGAIADDGFFKISDHTRGVIRDTLGSELIERLEYRFSWAIITHKGSAEPIDEGLSPNGLVVLTKVLTFPMD